MGTGVIAKSHETIVCTETATGMMTMAMMCMAVSRRCHWPRRSLPPQRERAVDLLAQPGGSVADGGEIRNRRQEQEANAAGQIRRDREEIPGQRRAKVGPDPALAGIGNHPVAEPGPPDVANGNDRADGQREYGDGLGAARDRTAPGGVGKAQNRGNQRAGVADADPENEIGDVERPEDRRVQAPHADAVVHLIEERADARQHQARRQRHGNPIRRAALEDRPQQILLDLFSRSLHLARCLAGDRSRSAACRVRRAVWCRDPSATAARLRYSDRSGRRRPAPWARTIARRPD